MSHVPGAWLPALEHSLYLKQLLCSQPELVALLQPRHTQPLDGETLLAWCDPYHDEESLKVSLRRLRQRAMAHIMLRDLLTQAALAEVVESMSLLADFCTNEALSAHQQWLQSQFGDPLDKDGQIQRLLVIGMGKLGGRELNVSSDVDYIFLYPEGGETTGARKIDNHDFFTRLGKRVIAALDEVTVDGRVFRVDMRLRPNGDSGPLVLSLPALENYLITHAREWERYAWIKARVMNTGNNAQESWIQALQQIARPFIFRKYLDFGAINAMRDLHSQIRREVAKKGMHLHIKLGPGGIREIEFIAQVFQLIRGGRESWLQVRPTLAVLKLLCEHGVIEPQAGETLREAYIFLRRLEHRLQYVDDKQTHLLPETQPEQDKIALSMGFADWQQFAEKLADYRNAVSRHFEGVFSDPEAGKHPLEALWNNQLETAEAEQLLSDKGFKSATEVLRRLHQMHHSSRYTHLPGSNRQRLDAVGPRLIEAASCTANPDLTWQRGMEFLENISGRGAYLALLQQFPPALKKVADMVGASSWAADYLNRHPILLDELLDSRLLNEASDWPHFESALQQQLLEHEHDIERQMDALREAHHAQVFRLLAKDLAGLMSIEHTSDHLSQLADIILQITLRLCWQQVRNRHCESPKVAIIGYGKLGGKELGYGSDLDLVYVFNDDQPLAMENYSRLVQRMNTWLGSTTSAGILFETDLRLRPNGAAGLLVSSLEAFRQYQLENAWLWEHQALTRARAVAGDSAVCAQFEAIRREILSRPGDIQVLKEAVLSMRQKMRENLASDPAAIERGEFDLKHDAGGIVDVEFMVQFLVLAHAAQYPQLLDNLGNIALLKMAGQLHLVGTEMAQAVADAYRHYRGMQHTRRLNHHREPIFVESVKNDIAAVREMWNTLFFL